MTDTIATPTAQTPPVPPPLKPGYQTSEAWITFVVMLIGAIPSSGLVDGAPMAARIVGLVIAGLSALGYTSNRTALKRAHLTATLASQS